MKQNSPQRHEEHEVGSIAWLRALRVFVVKLMFISAVLATVSAGAETLVKAELGVESAWVGEGVPLHITLHAPGPFSGTAVFDLPELPYTFIIKQGSPTVGSKTLRGETWMTQRHEFRIYTQQSGTIELPAIRVRFSAKKDFVSKPEPREGTTLPVRFESRLPPGARPGQMVVASPNMTITQVWSIDPGQTLAAGDVVERRIVRRATETTGMIFPDPVASAPEGVRVYNSAPIINDKIARGKSMAERVDIIKYQLSSGGIFQLPAMEFVWWDPQSGQLKKKVMEGASFETKMPAAEPITKQKQPWIWAIVFLPLLWAMLIIAGRIRNYLHQPERLAAKAVLSACRQNQPSKTYSALIDWLRTADLYHQGTLEQTLQKNLGTQIADEWKILSKILYSSGRGTWQGVALAAAFKTARKRHGRKRKHPRPGNALPRLNPT
ncbi:MAG: hypothetical protein ABFR47_00675 [Verrucomicrobiota bacterium]